jgi:hypothetical protein
MTSQDASGGSLIPMTSVRRSRRKNYNRKEVLLKTFNPFVTVSESAIYGVEIEPRPARIRAAPAVQNRALAALHSRSTGRAAPGLWKTPLSRRFLSETTR